MTNSNWLRVFPDEEHRFQMALRTGDAGEFWRCPNPQVLAERKRWIQANPDRYLGFVPGMDQLIEAALADLAQLAETEPGGLRELAGRVEPDWLLLAKDQKEWRVVAGAVVFPSSWALEEKLGRLMPAVHDAVPGLNAALGSAIRVFLDRLTTGTAWERWNWGLSADDELNHHPERELPGLCADADLENVWVRLENQQLIRLPCGLGLFGIRVTCHRLDELAAEPVVAGRICRALETMHDEAAIYKGIQAARPALISALRAAAGKS